MEEKKITKKRIVGMMMETGYGGFGLTITPIIADVDKKPEDEKKEEDK
jgi:hypothetical protein